MMKDHVLKYMYLDHFLISTGYNMNFGRAPRNHMKVVDNKM